MVGNLSPVAGCRRFSLFVFSLRQSLNKFGSALGLTKTFTKIIRSGFRDKYICLCRGGVPSGRTRASAELPQRRFGFCPELLSGEGCNPEKKVTSNEKKVIFVVWTVRKIGIAVFLLFFSNSTGSPLRASPTRSSGIAPFRRTSSWTRWSITGSGAVRCPKIRTSRPICSRRCATRRSITCAISVSANGRPTS